MITIIAGKYKGRKLSYINNNDVRPTQAKVKKSIFDILGPLNNKSILDLYSGVGGFGIEALSRGASHLTCVEKNPSVFKILLKNINNICKDDDVKLHSAGANQKLLWQLTVRFDVGRDLHFDSNRSRVCWDATTPIPHPGRKALASAGQEISALDPILPIRSWPAITIHDQETLAKVANMAGYDGYEQKAWEPNVTRW